MDSIGKTVNFFGNVYLERFRRSLTKGVFLNETWQITNHIKNQYGKQPEKTYNYWYEVFKT